MALSSLSEQIVKGQNNSMKMSDHARSKSQTSKSMNTATLLYNISLHMWNVLYVSTGLECNAVTFSMSGNRDFPCRQVNQYIIQICKCYCTAVPTPSHIAGVTLQTHKAVILYTCI
jgi:hypothetical protein